MIILDPTSKLQIVLAGAVATNQSTAVASWHDSTSSTHTLGLSTSTTNSTTAVDAVASPAASTTRHIKSFQLTNADTASITVTVRLNVSGTSYSIFKAILSVGDNLQYEDGAGWYVLDSLANCKSLLILTGRLFRAPQLYTASGPYSTPPGVKAIEFELRAGGGAGGGHTTSRSVGGGGGGAGGMLRKYLVLPGSSGVITVGAGANGNNNTGATGADTTFVMDGVTYTASGGDGGQGTASQTVAAVRVTEGGKGGSATNGDINARGWPGDPGISFGTTSACGGNGAWGRGGKPGAGFSTTSAAGNAAQANSSCGGGGAVSVSTSANSNFAGGAGGSGICIIREYY